MVLEICGSLCCVLSVGHLAKTQVQAELIHALLCYTVQRSIIYILLYYDLYEIKFKKITFYDLFIYSYI